MFLNPFQVRLKNDELEEGFSRGLVGTVIGMIPTQLEQGMAEVYKVLWFNYDEETGDTTPYPEAAAPSSHLATELVAFVDEFEDSYDDEEDSDQDATESVDHLFDESDETKQPTIS